MLATGRPTAGTERDAPAAGRLADGGVTASTPLTSGNGLLPRVPRCGRAAGGPGRRRAGRIGSRRQGYGRAVLPSRSGPPTVSGRWSLLPPGEPDRTRRLHALAGPCWSGTAS